MKKSSKATKLYLLPKPKVSQSADLAGWAGGGLLALCALPQVVQVATTGTAAGLNLGFLAMWWGGELLLTYAIWAKARQAWLVVNYLVNLAATSYLLAFKLLELGGKL